MEVHRLRPRHRAARRIALGITTLASLATLASCDGPLGDHALEVDRVEIAEARVTVAVGDSVLLRAVAYGWRDKILVSSKFPVRWASSAPAVARADPTSGWVVAERAGQATVSATVRDAADAAIVVVVPREP